MGDPWFDVERAALRKVSHASWMRLRVAGVVGAYKCACIAYRAGQSGSGGLFGTSGKRCPKRYSRRVRSGIVAVEMSAADRRGGRPPGAPLPSPLGRRPIIHTYIHTYLRDRKRGGGRRTIIHGVIGAGMGTEGGTGGHMRVNRKAYGGRTIQYTAPNQYPGYTG